MNLFKKIFAKSIEENNDKNKHIKIGDYLVDKDMNIYHILDIYYSTEKYYFQDQIKIKNLFTQEEKEKEIAMVSTNTWKTFFTLQELIEYFENITDIYAVEYTKLNEVISKIKVLKDNL